MDTKIIIIIIGSHTSREKIETYNIVGDHNTYECIDVIIATFP